MSNNKKSDLEHPRWRTDCRIKTKKGNSKKQIRHGQATILLRSIPEGKYRYTKILPKLQKQKKIKTNTAATIKITLPEGTDARTARMKHIT